MGLFLYSFKFQMGSLYISWQLSRFTKKKKLKKKQVADKESVHLKEEKWSAEWRGTEWKTFPLLSVSVFNHPLFPHSGTKP